MTAPRWAFDVTLDNVSDSAAGGRLAEALRKAYRRTDQATKAEVAVVDMMEAKDKAAVEAAIAQAAAACAALSGGGGVIVHLVDGKPPSLTRL